MLASEKKEKKLQIRLTEAEKLLLKQKAKDANLKVTDFIRVKCGLVDEEAASNK